MNVKEPLFPPSKPKHASKTTTTSHTISSTPTASIDLSGPSQHFWTMSQYLEISLPLTVGVILLPLIAGPWLRLASQQYDANRRHWQALFVVFSACYFVGLFVAYYIGSSSYDTGNNYIANFVYTAASYSVSGLIGIARTVGAYRNNKGRLRWSIQLLTVGICLPVDVVTITYVPWFIFPFVYIFLTSQMGIECFRRIWTWLSWKNKRQPGAESSLGTTV